MKKMLVFLAALVLLLTSAALAEVTVESAALDGSVYLSRATNCYYKYSDGRYQLFDAQGNVLSAAYKSLSARDNGLYYEYYNNTDTLNYIGLLDEKGQVITAPVYGKTYSCGDGWMLGYVLEAVAGDTGDFQDRDNNCYNAVRTDVICNGKVIGSLSREDFIPTFSFGVAGKYFYVRKTSETGYFLDENFNRYDKDKYVSSTEFEYDYRTKAVWHNPTGTKAFCAECTLTPEDVICPVWYDDKTDSLLDLQGNVIKSGLVYDSVYQRGSHLRINLNGNYGLMDYKGNVVVPPIYDDIAGYNQFFPQGYQAAVTPEGYLHYLDEQGNITAKAEYELSYSEYKGYSNNALFACVNNMGKIIVITATNGELPTKYQEFSTPRENHKILMVKKDGLWGAIDTAGNTVLPFIHRYTPEITNDSSLVVGQTETREYYIYRLTYPEKEAVETPAEPAAAKAEGTWECVCGCINTGKFCADCGEKKPADSWTCACGSVNTGKFCPECGSKKPDVAPQCGSCGYKPEGAMPKFCPECGAKF